MSSLTEQYQNEGFIVLPEVFSEEQVQALITETVRLCREEGARLPKSHLLQSEADEAPDFLQLPEEELMSHFLALHFPHKMSALFRGMLTAPELVPALQEVIGPNVKCMQSMLFIKQSGKPGQAWHQDEHFIPTRDRSLTGVWIALDDANVENGCLWVIPGSHLPGVLYPVRPPQGEEYDGSPEAFDYPHPPEAAVSVGVKRGSVVVFHGYLLHSSRRNRSPSRYRRALVHHYMSAESLLPWSCGGQIPPTQDNRDIVMVCGQDPYAWKGTEDLLRPYVRAEQQPSAS
ncbi:MAG: phytanoyl-CoA dioxygenase family protein [bacterium]|jgi:phytanoyl-CoA hydroxylase